MNNIISVGNKSAMIYVLAAITKLNESDTVIIKAFGKATSNAIDVALITKKYVVSLSIEDIHISNKIVKSKYDDYSISVIEITLSK